MYRQSSAAVLPLSQRRNYFHQRYDRLVRAVCSSVVIRDCRVRVNIFASLNVFFRNQRTFFVNCSLEVSQNPDLNLVTFERRYEEKILLNTLFLGNFQYLSCLLI